MKKINFEKLSDKDLFGKFEANKLLSTQSRSTRGGTMTMLCYTQTTSDDSDTNGPSEDLNDPRCPGSGY